MSYCRWSSDDFQCDVYVYESVGGGFVTNVAGMRVVFEEPLPQPVPFDKDHLDAFLARHDQVLAMVDAATREPIGLPYDGEDFVDPDAGTCADRLEALRRIGYRVPDYAIEALREEAEQGDSA